MRLKTQLMWRTRVQAPHQGTLQIRSYSKLVGDNFVWRFSAQPAFHAKNMYCSTLSPIETQCGPESIVCDGGWDLCYELENGHVYSIWNVTKFFWG
jgi:hypothetical protein